MSDRQVFTAERSAGRDDGSWWVFFINPDDGRERTVVCPQPIPKGDPFEIIRGAAVPLERA